MPRHTHLADLLVTTELPRQDAQHRNVDPLRRRRRRTTATPALASQKAPVGSHRVRAEIRHRGRAAELAAEPITERTVDRRVLTPRRRRRRPRRDPLRLTEQIATPKRHRRRSDHLRHNLMDVCHSFAVEHLDDVDLRAGRQAAAPVYDRTRRSTEDALRELPGLKLT